jgi:hypothetical protein
VKQRVERAGVDRPDRLRAGQQAFLDGVDGEAHRRARMPLCAARLEHVEAPLLDRELRVLHVAVVTFERAQDLEQPRPDAGEPVVELREVERGAHAGDHVLALRVDQEVAARLGRPCDLVARERHARAGRRAAVAEDHLLHVDGGAPVVGDVVETAVGDRARAVPGLEDGEDRLLELLARVGREVVQRGEAVGELAQRRGIEVGVQPGAALGLHPGDLPFEALARDAAHDVPEHLHEPAVRVPCEALVARARRDAPHRGAVEPDVEDGVHHPRHRVARAAAHRHQERVLGIAQPPAGAGLQACQRVVDGLRQSGRRAAAAQVLDARLGRDREPGRDQLRPEHARHLGHVGALAAEQVAHRARALVEVVDPSRRRWSGHAVNAGRRGA